MFPSKENAQPGGTALTLGAGTLAGRGSSSGSGNPEQITLGANLTLTGTVLSASSGGTSFGINLSDYATPDGGVSNNSTGVANALAAAKANGSYLVHTGKSTDIWLITYSIDWNKWGVEFDGSGQIICAYGSDTRQLNSKGDRFRDIVGREYLSHLIALLAANSAMTFLFSGDSITVGDGTADDMNLAIASMATKYGFTGVTCSKSAVSGTGTPYWLSNLITGDLATNPSLYILRWGVNDWLSDLTPDQTITNIRTGLAQCRAHAVIKNMSILLMPPTATGTADAPPHYSLNEKASEILTLGYRQAARDYGACFFDIYNTFRDAYSGPNAIGNYMDAALTHPKDVLRVLWNSAVADILFPTQLRVNG